MNSDPTPPEFQVARLKLELERIRKERLADVVNLEETLERLQGILDEVQPEAERAGKLRAHVQQIYGSWAYRIGRRIGLAPEPIEEE